MALVACGEQFVANGGSASNAGSSGLSEGNAAGEAEAAGSAGSDAAAGDAGTETGGVGGAPASGGMGGRLGSAGGSGGVSGTGGGAPIEPTLPKAGLLLWLRADHGVQQKDGHVQVWQDQSGNQADATQTSANERPGYLAAGFNGRPTLEFDGQGQFLTFADGFGDFSRGLAGLIVAKPIESDCAALLELSNGSEIEDVFLGVAQDKWQYEVESPFFQTGNVDRERFSLLTVNQRMSGAGELGINGNALSSFDMPVPSVPESGLRTHNFVAHSLYGGCGYFHGQISEIILYSHALLNSDLNAIEEYLLAHWALSEQDAPQPTP